MLRAAVVVLMLLPGLLPVGSLGPVPVPAEIQAKIDPVLLDHDFLQRDQYLTANSVPIIVMLNTEDAIKTSHAEFQAKKQQAVNVLKATGLPFTLKLDLKIIDGFSADVDLKTLASLAASKDVKSIWLNKKGVPLAAESIPLINADDAWTLTNSTGAFLTGQGIVIAVIDTGINYSHLDLGGCLGSGCKVIGGWDFVEGDSDPMPTNSHGTQVAGLLAAESNSPGGVTGVAKDASVLAYRACGAGSCEDNMVASIARAVDDGADIISISWTFSEEENGPVTAAANSAIDSNVVVVAGVGNFGTNSIGAPAKGKRVLGVGAVWDIDYDSQQSHSFNGYQCTDNFPRRNQLACYSSLGPGNEGVSKPDVVAPGSRIRTTEMNGGYTGQLHGTSFSTPQVAGIAALVKQKHSDWTVSQIKNKIKNSSVDLNWFNTTWNYGPNEQGAGRIDAYNALDDDLPSVQLSLPTYTTSWTHNVPYTCQDTNTVGDGERRLRLRNENGAWSNWTWHRHAWDPETDSSTIPWNLSSGQGKKTVYIECKDKGGNVASSTATVIVDTAAPVTAFALAPQLNPNGWSNSAVTVSLSADDTNGLAVDEVSGVQVIEYSLNGAPFQVYIEPLEVTAEGIHSVQAFATDNAGNTENTQMEPVRIDLTLPGTEASVDPSEPDGNQGWYRTVPTVSLSSSDGLSGVANLTYWWNSDPAVVTTNSTVETQPPGDGNHQLRYEAADRADNVEAVQLLELKVDATPPAVEVTKPVEDHIYLANHDLGQNLLTNDTLILGDFTFEVLASDVASGLVSVTFFLDGQQVATFSEGPFTWSWQSYLSPLGSHAFGVEAVDAAGHVAAKSMLVSNGPILTRR